MNNVHEKSFQDNVSEIISKEYQYIPVCQKLIKHGYKAINIIDMANLLNLDELTNKYNQELKRKLKDSGYSYFTGNWWYKNRLDHFLGGNGKYVETKQAQCEFIPLEAYISKEIPDRCLKEIKDAIDLGVKNLYVVQPTFKSPDPLIISKLEGQENRHWEAREYLFITRWE